MAKRKIRSVFRDPRVVANVAQDRGSSRLANIATAIEATLQVCHSEDGERQLRHLTWLLCRRCGGRICDGSAERPDECASREGCQLELVPAGQPVA